MCGLVVHSHGAGADDDNSATAIDGEIGHTRGDWTHHIRIPEPPNIGQCTDERSEE